MSSLNVHHILISADATSTNDLINELEDVPDLDELSSARDELFDCACLCFNEELKEKEIKEKPNFELKKRNTRSAKHKGTLAVCSDNNCDIVMLF